MLPNTFPEAFTTTITGLGAPLRYYPIKNLNRVSSPVSAIVFMLGSIATFLYGAYRAYTAYSLHGLSVVDDELTWPLIIAFVLFLLSLVGVWSTYTGWKRGVGVYERGMAVRNHKGITMWPWADIVSLTAAVTRHYTNGIYTGTTHVYTIFNRKQEKLVLNDVFKNVDQLADEIAQKIFPLLYEPASEKFNTGQSLDFGPILISKTGLQIGKKTFAWAEVKDVSLQRGELKISRRDGGWFSGASVSAANIPNLPVLLVIIKQVVGLKTG
jgi:hypothetical protein